MNQYILDENNNPVKTDLIGWAKWLQDNRNKRIIKQEDVKDLFVSTVFLGLDHSWHGGPPILFETMIFVRNAGRTDSDLDMGGEYQERCSTYTEALEMHKKAVDYAILYQTWEHKTKRIFLKVVDGVTSTLLNIYRTIRGKYTFRGSIQRAY